MPRTKTAKRTATKPDIFLDCGAPTLYNRHGRAVSESEQERKLAMGTYFSERGRDDHSWFETDEFKVYRQAYADFVKERGSLVTTYSNLDVINNGELTFENQKFFEDQGLQPIPVWHLGTDEKWLVHYLKAGYKYIAMGGILPNKWEPTITVLDHVWQKYLTDKDGYPLVKVHGFGATATQYLNRYPWYSVDSTNWIKYASYGIILCPKLRHGQSRFDLFASKIGVTNRFGPTIAKRHIGTLSRIEHKQFVAYIEGLGYRLGRSHIKEMPAGYKPDDPTREQVWKKLPDKTIIEVIDESGVVNNSNDRVEINAYFYLRMTESFPSWPWPYHPSKARVQCVGLFDEERPERSGQRDDKGCGSLRLYLAGLGYTWTREAAFFTRFSHYPRLATLAYSRRCNQILDLAQSMRKRRGLHKRKRGG